MRKTYCSKCHYWIGDGNVRGLCSAPDNILKQDTPIRRTNLFLQMPEEKNAGNNCPSFRRKMVILPFLAFFLSFVFFFAFSVGMVAGIFGKC
jgi:hypothetical protein